MAEVKSGIQALFAGAEFTKDGKMPKAEVEKVCVELGMTADEVGVMFAEIAKDGDSVDVSTLMDWIFEAEAEAKEEKKAADEEEEEEEDDVEDELDEPPPPPQKSGARASVSAEAYGAWNTKKEFVPPSYPKTDEQKTRIKSVLTKSFMFQAVAPKDFDILLLAVEELKVAEGDKVIKQGDDGDFMCIIETGKFDCIVGEKVVKTCEPGDVFGELALMYNAPRAASVQATTEGTAWKLDRETFNHIVKDAAAKKRSEFENFLKKVPLMEKMGDSERSQVADALREEVLEDGKTIITEGEEGNSFYIVAEGEATASKKDSSEVLNYKPGDFFGELALLKDQPRAATVTSKGPCKVLTLDRKSFNRLIDKSILSTTSYNF